MSHLLLHHLEIQIHFSSSFLLRLRFWRREFQVAIKRVTCAKASHSVLSCNFLDGHFSNRWIEWNYVNISLSRRHFYNITLSNVTIQLQISGCLIQLFGWQPSGCFFQLSGSTFGSVVVASTNNSPEVSIGASWFPPIASKPTTRLEAISLSSSSLVAASEITIVGEHCWVGSKSTNSSSYKPSYSSNLIDGFPSGREVCSLEIILAWRRFL